MWDADTHKHLATLAGHTGGVTCLTLYGNKLFSASDDRTIRVWDADTHKHLATLEGHTSYVSCLTLYGNKLLLSGSMIGPFVCGMPIRTSTWLPWQGILTWCDMSHPVWQQALLY